MSSVNSEYTGKSGKSCYRTENRFTTLAVVDDRRLGGVKLPCIYILCDSDNQNAPRGFFGRLYRHSTSIYFDLLYSIYYQPVFVCIDINHQTWLNVLPIMYQTFYLYYLLSFCFLSLIVCNWPSFGGG